MNKNILVYSFAYLSMVPVWADGEDASQVTKSYKNAVIAAYDEHRSQFPEKMTPQKIKQLISKAMREAQKEIDKKLKQEIVEQKATQKEAKKKAKEAKKAKRQAKKDALRSQIKSGDTESVTNEEDSGNEADTE